MFKKLKKETTRRFVLKKTATIGAVVTGIGAATGTAAAQPSVNIVESASNLTTDTAGGQDLVTSGLIAVNVSGVSLNALNQNTVAVQIGGDVVDIGDITVEEFLEIELEDVNVAVTDLADVLVSVAILGASGISNQESFDLTRT